MTQREQILKHLQNHGSITSMEAFSDYGVTRLSAVIFDLRRDGHNIISHMICTKNRYGEPTHFAKYELIN